MIKKILYIMLACVLAFGALSLSGCKEEPKGQTYELEEAYQNGWLNRDDIMHISYNWCGRVMEEIDGQKREIDFVPTKELIPLDKNVEHDIKVTFLYEVVNPLEQDNFDLNRVNIEYFGEYNGCYAILLTAVGYGHIAVMNYRYFGGIVWEESFPWMKVFRYN